MEESLPCPTCRAAADPQARMCLQCGASLLVDVALSSHVADGRARYRLSRSLQSLPGAPPLTTIQNALQASPPSAGRGVTRAYAHGALGLLAENGLRATIEKHVERRRAGDGGFPLRPVLGGLAAIVVLGLGYAAWQRFVDRAAPAELRLTIDDLPSDDGGAPAARRAAAEGPDLSPRELARTALAAAASLRCSRSVGSGFFVAPDLVVTNAHVLCPAGESVQVTLADDQTFTGQVLKRDDAVDLGLVRVTGASATPLALGDVGDLAVGDRVVIVGSPAGLDFSVQEGSISSLQRSSDGVAYIQLDSKISPGNSGGPVVDSRGRVVGVVSMKVSGDGIEGIGIALPINYVYSPEIAFVRPPSPGAAGSEAFRQMLARAESGSDVGAREAHAAPAIPGTTNGLDDRPLLLSGRVDQYGRLVVGVLRATEYPPGFEEIEVTVWSGTESFCTIKGDIGEWKLLDASVSAALDPRAMATLRRMAPEETFYLGESPLRWDLCDRTRMRRGIQIELAGANPVASRLEVR